MVSIRERPTQADDSAVPGHWDADLPAGSNRSFIATLDERKSHFVMLMQVQSSENQVVIRAITQRICKLRKQLLIALTSDRGKELSSHKDFSLATDVKTYFCDPHSPWRCGSKENTYELLRQHFPKGTDLSSNSQLYVDRDPLRLNQRPRETLAFDTPADSLNASIVASTP
jgi:IS30 family transposase